MVLSVQFSPVTLAGLPSTPTQAHINSSVQFSLSVMSDSLKPHGLQHTRPPCPSPTPRVYSNSCPLSRQCHPTISSSVIPFSSSLQSFLASGYFLMSQFFSPSSGSVTQLCPTLHDHKNRSMPGLPVHHQLPGSTQTHVI